MRILKINRTYAYAGASALHMENENINENTNENINENINRNRMNIDNRRENGR